MENGQIAGLAVIGGAVALYFLSSKSPGASNQELGGAYPDNNALDKLTDFLNQTDGASPISSLLNPEGSPDKNKNEVIPSAGGSGAKVNAGSSAAVTNANVDYINQVLGGQYLTKKAAAGGGLTIGGNASANITDSQLTQLLAAAASGSNYGRSNVDGTITAFGINNSSGGGATPTKKKEAVATTAPKGTGLYTPVDNGLYSPVPKK